MFASQIAQGKPVEMTDVEEAVVLAHLVVEDQLEDVPTKESVSLALQAVTEELVEMMDVEEVVELVRERALRLELVLIP
jgi:hypothetical protein